MKFAYVAVIEAPTEERARAYLNAQLRTGGPQSPAVMTGGGKQVSETTGYYVTGPVAAAIAEEAFKGESPCGHIAWLLHREAVD